MSGHGLYQLESVTQTYGGRRVLDIDLLDIPAGSIQGLLGPTGAGKSTLLRLLAAVEPPASGQLRFGEHRLVGRHLPLDVQRRITLVFQRPLMLAGTVRANVEYGLRLRGRTGRSSRVQAILERLGLAKLAARPARSLSGGEAQMVALARALVLDLDVLLLDEPTAHLDPARVAVVEALIGEIHRERGITVVWATHNLFQARRVAQRTALLLEGRLVEESDTKAFFESPRDPRTAAFVRGEMIY
jgi:tungstate transport system ATP-binding protein